MTEKRISANTKVDWDLVEPHYRAAVMSLSEIAREFNCTSGRICQVAKKRDWKRDLSKSIRLAAYANLQRQNNNIEGKEAKEETSENNTKTISEETIVKSNAELISRAMLSHRSDIQALRKRAKAYHKELDSCGDDLSKRASILKVLTEVQKALIGVERQALGIADTIDGNNDAAPRKELSDLEKARRVAFILAKGMAQEGTV